MNNELLERIERLEEAVRDIRASCSCLSIEPEPGSDFNCEPPSCEDCGEFNCVCVPETEDIDEEPEDKDHD